MSVIIKKMYTELIIPETKTVILPDLNGHIIKDDCIPNIVNTLYIINISQDLNKLLRNNIKNIIFHSECNHTTIKYINNIKKKNCNIFIHYSILDKIKLEYDNLYVFYCSNNKKTSNILKETSLIYVKFTRYRCIDDNEWFIETVNDNNENVKKYIICSKLKKKIDDPYDEIIKLENELQYEKRAVESLRLFICEKNNKTSLDDRINFIIDELCSIKELFDKKIEK